MDKRTPVPPYRLLSSPSNKQKAFNSSHGSSHIIRYNFIILTSKLQHEYLWFYISAKNGSVFKTIPEIHRKEIIRMKLLNWRFTLRYKSKPKRNLFLGHPVLWSEFSEMVRIRTILQISVRIRSEFAQKLRFFQFLSLTLPKNLEKEAFACAWL